MDLGMERGRTAALRMDPRIVSRPMGLLLLVAGALAVPALLAPGGASADPGPRKAAVPSPAPAEPATAWANAQVLQQLPFADRQDYTDASKGFIATFPDVTMVNDQGAVVYTLRGFDFLKAPEAPATVNPSLWRHAQINMNNGLFEVVPGVYQIRGFDLANMTIVEGNSGVVVIDPLEANETSRAGLDLYYAHRGVRPVKAVIYTHSHHDHYAGARGVISEEDGIPVIAPEGFVDAAVSENVYAGMAMARRASYMYGVTLPRGERGLVNAGLANAKSQGTTSFLSPTDTIQLHVDTRSIDGVDFEFVLVSGTEAPSEMTLYLPRFRVLDSAEIACPLLHNVVTLRGAQVRDAKKWAESLNELIARYGDATDVLIAQHNWPRWGKSDVVRLLADQRDLYKYMHDQTLHLANQGYTPMEIAERIQLPPSLSQLWYVRGYYGTLSHDVKAIYQRYLGWFDGNPANLNPLPPADAARKLLEYMGGPQAVTARARQDFKRGEYRWVAQLMNQVVFAYPDFAEGRYLQADALEQLGYQAESGVWRNFYLTGAQELRKGAPPEPPGTGAAGPDVVRAMPMPLLFDYMGVLLNAEKANGQRMVLNWTLTDTGERYALNLSNDALTYRGAWHDPTPTASIALTRAALNALLVGAPVDPGAIQVTGDTTALPRLLRMFDKFKMMWPIVTP